MPLETALGERKAYPYVLYPGPNYVYVDAAAPHLILRLTQRFEGGLLEAFLDESHPGGQPHPERDPP